MSLLNDINKYRGQGMTYSEANQRAQQERQKERQQQKEEQKKQEDQRKVRFMAVVGKPPKKPTAATPRTSAPDPDARTGVTLAPEAPGPGRINESLIDRVSELTKQGKSLVDANRQARQERAEERQKKQSGETEQDDGGIRLVELDGSGEEAPKSPKSLYQKSKEKMEMKKTARKVAKKEAEKAVTAKAEADSKAATAGLSSPPSATNITNLSSPPSAGSAPQQNTIGIGAVASANPGETISPFGWRTFLDSSCSAASSVVWLYKPVWSHDNTEVTPTGTANGGWVNTGVTTSSDLWAVLTVTDSAKTFEFCNQRVDGDPTCTTKKIYSVKVLESNNGHLVQKVNGTIITNTGGTATGSAWGYGPMTLNAEKTALIQYLGTFSDAGVFTPCTTKSYVTVINVTRHASDHTNSVL